jgi:hypothetical protein
MKRKHADLIHAWADGAQIQLFSLVYDRWEDVKDPSWSEHYEYRIKPEPHPDFIKRFYLEVNPLVGHRFSEAYSDKDLVNKHSLIKCTFDGETTKLKSVEII